MLFSEMIDRANELAAGIGGDVNASPFLDAEITLEAAAPHVFHFVGTQIAKDERRRPLLLKKKTVAFTDGEATLSNDVLRDYLDCATFYDNVNLTANISFVKYYEDIFRGFSPTLAQIGSFAMRTHDIAVYVPPNNTYDEASGFTGNLSVTTVCVPVIPTLVSDAVDVADAITDDLVAGLADCLRGGKVWDAIRTGIAM